jgi:hypothetical protein
MHKAHRHTVVQNESAQTQVYQCYLHTKHSHVFKGVTIDGV